MNFKYVRIQGREIAPYTDYENGVFGIFRDFERKHVLSDEDFDLYKEIDSYFAETLPWPPMCNELKKVVCFFKTENTVEMLKYVEPLLWLLERYNHPYDVVYTNFPGTIVYEDDYQIVVTVDDLLYDEGEIDQVTDDIFERLDGASR